VAVTDILNNHIFQERGFAHAGFPDYIHMAAAIVGFNPKRHFLISEVGFGKNGN
jgi:hypothetical protein